MAKGGISIRRQEKLSEPRAPHDPHLFLAPVILIDRGLSPVRSIKYWQRSGILSCASLRQAFFSSSDKTRGLGRLEILAIFFSILRLFCSINLNMCSSGSRCGARMTNLASSVMINARLFLLLRIS